MNIQSKRSLGSLRIQQKTKPKSPEMIGTISLQRETLETLIKQIGISDELVANLAAWKNHDGLNHYLTVEVSPRFSKFQQPAPKQKEQTIFDVLEAHGEYHQ